MSDGPQQWTDPLHSYSNDSVRWTRANAEEIFPAAITHFTWTFVGPAGERGWRQSFIDVGILSSADAQRPEDPSDCAWAVFYGRPAFNFKHLKSFAFAAFSSTDPDARAMRLKETALGRLRRGGKTVRAVMTLPAQLRALRRETENWWRSSVQSGPARDDRAAARQLREALDYYERASRLHVLNSVVPVAWSYARLAAFAQQAKVPELAPTLMSGFQALEEVRLAESLWEVAKGRETLQAFISRFGYRGPVESEASSRSWREDPAPLRDLVEGLRQAGEEKDPRRAHPQRVRENRAAVEQLFKALPRADRLRARVALLIGRKYIPLRQLGKVMLVQSIDVARASARTIGESLQRQGRLDQSDDIFFLTTDEVLSAPESLTKYQPMVTWRRANRERYLKMDLPRDFFGVPEDLNESDTSGPGAEPSISGLEPEANLAAGAVRLTGQGVSGGIVEGTARVLRNAGDSLEVGEILVAQFTDPGWTPLMVTAAGIVLDVGGLMSHGAIIARELAVPCVVGTQSATTLIRTGDRVRVDGTLGQVEVLPRV